MKNKKFKLLIGLLLIMALSIVLASVAFAEGEDEEQPFVPDHTKDVIDNKNGTYTISLDVTGDADTDVTKTSANVLIIYDASSSMNYLATNPTGQWGDTDEDHPGGAYGGTTFQLYKEDGDGYTAITDDEGYEGTVYRNNNGNYQRYNGLRFETSSRADLAEQVVYNFADDLFDEGADVALVSFSGSNTATTQAGWTAPADRDNLLDKISSITYASGTNWDAAFQQALTVLNALKTKNDGQPDKDPVFVVFITDGAPTRNTDDNDTNQYTCYQAAQSGALSVKNFNADAEATGSNTTLYGIYAYGSEGDYLDDLVYYAYNGTARSGESDATDPTDCYYNASDTSAVQAAINQIFSQIASTLGIEQVSMTDGTTSNVATSSGVAHLLDVDDQSFKYWLTIPGIGSDGSFTRIDPDSGDEITYKATASGDQVTITWKDADGENQSVTVTGSISDGKLKYQWEEANAFYNVAPPAATFTNGSVNWDLKSAGTLLSGVTYTVTFDCWPSQTTLDYIADIKNDPTAYDKLDENIKKYLSSDGSLKTNTGATLNYTDSRTDDGPQSADFTAPKPVSSQAVEQLAVAKVWENDLDTQNQPDVTFDVTRDGKKAYTVLLSKNNTPEPWKNKVYISVGIMRTNDKGVVEVLSGAEGHDFTFTEPKNVTYHWELDIPVVHPMMIDGKETMLIKVDEKHPLPEGDDVQTYTINGAQYFVQEGETASLTATNYRRSSLILTKAVTGTDIPEDATFPFTLNVVNSLASTGSANNLDSDYYVWISVRDMNEPGPNGRGTPVTTGVSGATPEADENGNPKDNGWYYAPSGTDVTIQAKAGYSIRVNNLPTDSSYTITEGTLPTGFVFDKAEIAVTEGDGTANEFKAGQTSSGEIEDNNTEYTVTYTNKYELIDVNVDKVWDDESDKYELRPETLELTLSGAPEGTTIPDPEITESEDGNTWTYVWKGLPKNDATGAAIEYKVSENEVPEGYTCQTTEVSDEGTITNALAIGTLKITKSVSGGDDSISNYNVTVMSGNNYVKTDGTLSKSEVKIAVAKGETGVTIEVPAGDYTVAEVAEDANIDGYSLEIKYDGSVATSKTAKVDDGGTTTVAITNTYEAKPGTITVTKTFDGIQESEIPSNFKITGAGETDLTISTADEGSAFPTYTWTVELEAGTYNIAEEGAGVDGYELTATPENGVEVTLEKDGTGTAEFTNAYEAKPGTITVTKTFDGIEESKIPSGFKITGAGETDLTIANADEGSSFEAGYTWTVELEAGEYTITETGTDINGYTLTATPEEGVKVTLEKDGTASADFTNSYSRDKGTLKIEKKVVVAEGSAEVTPPDGLTFNISGPDDYDGPTSVTYGEDFTDGVYSAEVVTGNYTVTENTSTAEVEGYDLTETTSDPEDGEVTVSTTEDGEVTITNSYKQNFYYEYEYGDEGDDLTVNKTDAETGEALAGATFTLTYGGVTVEKITDDQGVASFDLASFSEVLPKPAEDPDAAETTSIEMTLEETAAPEGYVLPDETEQTVTVSITVSEPELDAEKNAYVITTTYAIDGDRVIAVENEPENDEGMLKIVKTFDGPADLPETTKFKITGPDYNETVSIKDFEKTGDSEYTYEVEVEAGEYTVTENKSSALVDGYTLHILGDNGVPRQVTEKGFTFYIRNRYADPSSQYVPEELNGEDHYAYMIGYPDGLVQPHWNITRAEVATIFFRLLTDEAREANLTTVNTFGDVNEGQWFNVSISTMANMGIVNGYPDGDFHPNDNITRAEFAAIAARFDKEAKDSANIFTDIDGHWAKSYILRAVNRGWINGYPDSTFRPDRLATRAEVAAMVNRVLVRDPEDPDDLLPDMIKWPDNMDTNAWYYLDIQEATNTHEYERVTKPTEVWIQMLENPDWTKYQY
ncbi:MAG: S-layer homology domain-containing protein [Firmicutes bacterium]|nr:S-layer homology domain-containing protein [Bacillota bacterium]